VSSPKDVSASRPATPRRAGALQSAARAVRYRLLIPLFRSPHPPEFTARGVAVGVFWGLTPLVGAQTALMGTQWLIARRLGWGFSLLQAFAWSWVSNVFTMLPLYYLFYATGMALLGSASEAAGYEKFVMLWQQAADAGNSGGLLTQLALVVRVLGLPAFVGCLPWALGGSWIAYAWSYRIVERRQRRRLAREKASGEPVAGSPAA
jgi:uncharacterized protein (DUF2062 family)